MSRFLSCVLFFVTFVCHAQLRSLPPEFHAWLSSKGMKHATVAMEIAALSHEGVMTTLYAYDNERAVQPASLMKLVTTAAALNILGEDMTVPTEVFYVGEIGEGTLHGDLIIKGHGNAMLASSRSKFPKDAFSNSVVSALKKAGIKKIEGNIIGDGTALKGNPLPGDWIWEDMGNHFAPSISGLNFGDNRYEIVLDTSHKGQKPTVEKIVPEVEGIMIDNQLLSLNYPFDSAYIYGAPFQKTRTIYGAVPHSKPTFTIKGDVPDPSQFTVSCLKQALVKSGISVTGNAISAKSPIVTNLQPLTIFDSESISYIASQTNIYSVNLFAEMLLRQIALKTGDGSETAGISEVKRLLGKWNINLDGFRMYDGCGLAPNDRVTPHLLVTLLNQMQNTKFISTLPIAGKSGTVANFLKGTRFEGKAYLKTGTTKTVIGYSGYVTCDDGRIFAVSIIVNNHTCNSLTVRKNIEKMLLLLIP